MSNPQVIPSCPINSLLLTDMSKPKVAYIQLFRIASYTEKSDDNKDFSYQSHFSCFFEELVPQDLCDLKLI